MNLQHLETFLAVARAGSFTRATDEVHLTQSAVSRQIQDLERSLGVQLFERLGRTITVTPAGKVLIRGASRLLQEARNLQESLRDLDGQMEGDLRVGGTVTATNTFLPRLMVELRVRNPGLRLFLQPGHSPMLAGKLRSNELDVAVLGGAVDQKGLAVEGEVVDELVVVAAPSHPLAVKGRVHAEQLDRLEFISRSPGADSQALADTWFRGKGVRPSKVLELH